MAVERVRVLKREYASDGGDGSDESAWPDEIKPNEDAINCRRVYLQQDTGDDSEVYLDRDGDDLKLRDPGNASGVSLTTIADHATRRQLIHFIDDGPAEGFASGAYREVTGSPFPTLVTWYTSSAKTSKILDKAITYSGVFPTSIVWTIYDTDGATPLATVTDAITYSGPFESTRERTIA